ncbi:MAG: GNAT family N-acetyltransferase [Methylococcales bacterium]|jgi:ribosomal protein S18 acetylase RimI-like enzyme|nr:GNAT family N-acetyltransferase [Methylococcales bacterium]
MALWPAKNILLPSGLSVGFRVAAEGDSDDLVRVFAGVVAEGDFTIITQSELSQTSAQELRRVQIFADSTSKLYLVAEVAGQVVGMGTASGGNHLRTAHVASLSLFVEKPFRGRRIGQNLLVELMSWAQSMAFEKLTLSVYQNNYGAIQLYHKMGFEIEAQVKKAVKVSEKRYEDIFSMVYWCDA